MKRMLVTGFAQLVLLSALLFVAPGTAEAGSGGGCLGAHQPVDPCISQNGNWIYADFYVNFTPPDVARCRGILQIIKDGRIVASQDYNLTSAGRYGPITSNRYSIPPSSGVAFARVHVYTCNGTFHYRIDSPKLYYP